MAELIEKAAVLRIIFDGIGKPATEIYQKVRELPGVEAVEVVRCKECKYRAEDDFCTGRGWPMQLVADDGFCEKGKRKT